ncbi:hypothetical protein GCM10009863_61280 [Streptomyces axinellae]|uniref:Uncharacterized protein n=1 Tax=Streptomyces axinellae TaxID=552788 RepID=A0ABN3QWB4_9ACTN
MRDSVRSVVEAGTWGRGALGAGGAAPGRPEAAAPRRLAVPVAPRTPVADPIREGPLMSEITPLVRGVGRAITIPEQRTTIPNRHSRGPVRQ